MTEDIYSPTWYCMGKSSLGASHKRSRSPNQDAIKFFPETGIGLPVIMAVSDGHGSAKSFRSDKGSSIAVEAAIQVIQEFFWNSQADGVNFSTVKDSAERVLPQKIVKEWRKAVNRDLGLPEDSLTGTTDSTDEANFTDAEKQTLMQKDGEMAWQAIKNNKFLAYGATLLAVLVTDAYIIYLQLGDGDILQVDSKGNTVRPLPRNPEFIANETTSLCMDKAWDEFQVHIELHPKAEPENMPVLILVATDGYSNSFSTDEGFLTIGQDYQQMFKSNLIEEIRQQLEEILQQTSEKGSGDDITLGIIKRLETNDREYLEKRFLAVERKLESSNMRQQENFLGIENKVNKLNQQQNNTSKAVLRAFSLIAASFLISTSLIGYLFFRLNGVEKNLKELKHPNGQGSSPSPVPSSPASPLGSPEPSPKQS
jgi:serine/threonine protein phosphatase PrpC